LSQARKPSKVRRGQFTQKKSRFTKIAKTSAEKGKEAAQFFYKHRKKIMEALELLTAVIGTASLALGKPGKPRRRKRKTRRV
jgi:hypothetical protein